jgi:hypothetical protein
MSKQLYEEALADAKKLKEIAEDNAKRALVEAVTPRIRDLIEKELLREYNEVEDDFGVSSFGEPGAPPPEGDLMTDDMMGPPAEGDVMTFDFAGMDDDMGAPVDPPMFGGEDALDGVVEYGLDMESIDLLLALINASSRKSTLEHQLVKLGEGIRNAKYSLLAESRGSFSDVKKLISNVENMYNHVQESVKDANKKNEYELTLEAFYKELNKLQEQIMRRNRLNRLHEKKLMFTIDGLPDDLDDEALDNLEISITSGEGEEGGDELDMGDEEDEEGGDEGGDEGGEELDLDLGDLGGDDEGGDDEEEEPQEEGHYTESRRLRDNLIVEIDEGMLRREIGRMKVIREARTLKARRLAEARRHRARRLAEEAVPSTKGYGPGKSLKSFGGGKDDGDPWLDQELTLEMDGVDGVGEMDMPEDDMREDDVAFSPKHESYRRNNGARRNGTPQRHAVQAESNLRAKLAESNLFNAKLIYTNKLLQNESLSKRQKAEIIERLDEAESLREVKLVYESLTKTLAGTSRPLSESTGRRVIGSSSRATRPASTNLNEGFETDRWARLAGITK